ncbi:MAG: LacI family DNA-binding transcriptional regulator [Granulosicoccus sp.]|nr:LacI family DNA-binding transcriptional regulator [Granulosicoccus sp.]
MKKNEPPTLEDVARLANVSTATISRSINEPDKVAEKTRSRIQQIIDAVGYTPNFGARVLARSRSNTVGAIIPTMENAMFASGLQAFQETLAASGVTLLVASSGYSTDHEFSQIRSLVTHGADGLMLIGSSRPQETLDFLALRNVPYVLSWCCPADTSKPYAGFDNSAAAHALTMEILHLGHRNIAMIAGKREGNDRANNRVEGVMRAVQEFGSSATLSAVVESAYQLEQGGIAFEQLMSSPKKPSAIICGNDVLAAGAVLRADRIGIRVPHDVSITGFDDISLASVVSPTLTTVRVPQIDMGKSAAKLLLGLLADEQPESLEFATEIIHRESLAPPAN